MSVSLAYFMKDLGMKKILFLAMVLVVGFSMSGCSLKKGTYSDSGNTRTAAEQKRWERAVDRSYNNHQMQKVYQNSYNKSYNSYR